MIKPIVRTLLPVLFVSTFLVACGGKEPNDQKPAALAADSTKKKDYFPVLGFLRGELANVDSLPGGILQLVRNGSMTDSSYINSSRVHELANEFLTDELKDENFEAKYKETAFYDNSSQTSTFIYDAIEPSVLVRRVDVISKSGAAYDKVLSIYMEKNFRQNDTAVIKKLQWMPGKQLQLISEKRINNDPISSELTTVIWDTWSGSE